MPDADEGDPLKAPRYKSRSKGWNRVVEKVKNDTNKRKTNKKEETAQDRAARRTADATVGIRRLTLVLAVISILNLVEIWQGGRDTSRMATAAQEFADTAPLINGNIVQAVGKMQSQSNSMNKIAQADLAGSRGWVGVTGTGFKLESADGPLRGQVTLENSGNAPALKIHGWWCIEVRKDNPPAREGRLQKSGTRCFPIPVGTLAHGSPAQIPAIISGTPPPDFQIEGTSAGDRFYDWGRITYEITPSDGKRHLMSFCFKNIANDMQMGVCGEGVYGIQAD